MNVLPIVGRELRVTARRSATYWRRSGAAFLILIGGAACLLLMRSANPQEISLGLFGTMTAGALLYGLLAGVQSTSDCLSWEKREGTLGLLFLTDLRGYDVVIGKLAATSMHALYGLLAVVPMLALPLLMGGVAPAEFGRMALVILNSLFFSLAVGMFVSALSKSARSAVAVTLILLLVANAFLPFVGSWLRFHQKLTGMENWFYLPSSVFTFIAAFDTNYTTKGWYGATSFWRSLGVIHASAWVLLIFSCFIVPRSWQDRPSGTRKARWGQRWYSWTHGSPADRQSFRRRLLSMNAFSWLAARPRYKPAFVWLLLGIATCLWLWGLAKYRRDWLGEPNYILTAALLNLFLKQWFASETVRQLAEDHHSGSLELILSTSLTEREIVRGQWLALRRQFLGPLLLIMAVEVVFMFAPLSEMDREDKLDWILFFGGLIFLQVADLMGLFWVGMWQALKASSPARASRATKVRILIWPWIVMAAVGLLVLLVNLQFTWEPGSKFFLLLWIGLSVATDLGFGLQARQSLLTKFRTMAAQRFAYKPTLWEKFRGKS